MIQKKATAQETLDVLGDFLNQVKSEKEAETVSFKDKPEATPTEQSKPKGSEGQVDQTNLGKEQKQDADDGGSTADSTPENSDSLDAKPTDDQGPKRLDIDDPVASDGNLGPMRKQDITQEQKTARAEKLGNLILTKIAEEVGALAGDGGGETPADLDEVNKEASEVADAFLDDCLQKSANYAQTAHDSYLYGMLKRAQDEAELAGADFSQVGLDAETLQKIGGVSGLLDKVAAENPMDVMPEGMEDAMPMGGEMGGMPPMDPSAMGGEMGMEGAGMPAEEGGVTEEDLAELSDMLAEAGVEPEAIDEAAEAIAQLAEAGVAPEEAAEAIREIVEESMAGGGEEGGMPMEGAEEGMPPVEDSMEEVPKEASDKEAKARIAVTAAFLREKLK